MKIIEHGIFYNDTVNIRCNRCDCKYQITKDDIQEYPKCKKVEKCAWDDIWSEKYDYYTCCPECTHDNELEYRDYEILTTNIKKRCS